MDVRLLSYLKYVSFLSVALHASYPGLESVSPSDNLWRLAKQIVRNVKQEPLSIQQVMMALYSKNPSAFIHDNINGLMSGERLLMPSYREMLSRTHSDAIDEVARQNDLWKIERIDKTLSSENFDQIMGNNTQSDESDIFYFDKAVWDKAVERAETQFEFFNDQSIAPGSDLSEETIELTELVSETTPVEEAVLDKTLDTIKVDHAFEETMMLTESSLETTPVNEVVQDNRLDAVKADYAPSMVQNSMQTEISHEIELPESSLASFDQVEQSSSDEPMPVDLIEFEVDSYVWVSPTEDQAVTQLALSEPSDQNFFLQGNQQKSSWTRFVTRPIDSLHSQYSSRWNIDLPFYILMACAALFSILYAHAINKGKQIAMPLKKRSGPSALLGQDEDFFRHQVEAGESMLDLARAYVKMGNVIQARQLLNKVMAQNNNELSGEAKRLLAEIKKR